MCFLDAPTATIQQCSTPVTEGNDATLMALVTRLQMLRGLEKVQDKLCQQTRCLSLKPSKAMDLAVMNVLFGMALRTSALTPVQLTYAVSKKISQWLNYSLRREPPLAKQLECWITLIANWICSSLVSSIILNCTCR